MATFGQSDDYVDVLGRDRKSIQTASSAFASFLKAVVNRNETIRLTKFYETLLFNDIYTTYKPHCCCVQVKIVLSLASFASLCDRKDAKF